ncbi:hypothetical protein PSHT_06208 [Puccinia striiformis]|uniref:Uncharacterized protein n=1 Tax=Puccinia striiformis TaxID=27350 RepID=A0A2S4W8N4_9BASI|nr:hypothetical protein PSHT_06208 [Puccinia striiformis]
MVFVPYTAPIKVVVVQMSSEGHTLPHICNTLGYLVSRQSLTRWKVHKLSFLPSRSCLSSGTPVIVPYTHPRASGIAHEQRGRAKKLSSEDSTFMITLLRKEPGLFLDKIREKVYDGTGVLLSISAVHNNFVNQLCITLKKAETLNIKKCLVKKLRYVDDMKYYPAEFLVFRGDFRNLSYLPTMPTVS